MEENAVWAVGALIDEKSVTVGLCNLLGQLVFSKQTYGDCSSIENAQQTLTNLVTEALDYASSVNTTVIGMGVSIPGMVMRDTGAVRYSAILDWQDVMLAKRLEAAVHSLLLSITMCAVWHLPSIGLENSPTMIFSWFI